MQVARDRRPLKLSDHPSYQTERAKFEAMLRSARPGMPGFELAIVFGVAPDTGVELFVGQTEQPPET